MRAATVHNNQIPSLLRQTGDPDVRRALEWFLGFIGRAEWANRKAAIETYLESAFRLHPSEEEKQESAPISIVDDQIGWYLYLAETSLNSPPKYEPEQGARVLPIFKRLGHDHTDLTRIRGISDKVSKLVSVGRSQADATLFELLVGLLWVRNGWREIEFVQEAPSEKRPDIRATSATKEWFVECKRLAKSSTYSVNEREKWLRMWMPLARYLAEKCLPLLLDIVFHVELWTLPDDFLLRELADKLPLVTSPGVVISRDNWKVSVKRADLWTAKAHIAEYYVKIPSEQLNMLIAGRRDPSRGFSCVVKGGHVRAGDGPGNNRYLESIEFAAGAMWDCDNEQAIEFKARDIKRHLVEATAQLPANTPGVVHIGLETLDGWMVEVERYRRIVDSVMGFNARNKDLRWVYCHLFQSYAPPDKLWIIDETVYHFSHTRFAHDEPLNCRTTILPEGVSSEGVHWLREAP